MQLLFSLSSNACTQGRVFVFAAEAEAEGCSLAAGAALAVLSLKKETKETRSEKRLIVPLLKKCLRNGNGCGASFVYYNNV